MQRVLLSFPPPPPPPTLAANCVWSLLLNRFIILCQHYLWIHRENLILKSRELVDEMWGGKGIEEQKNE